MERISLDIVIKEEQLKSGKIIFTISSIQVPNVITQGNTIEESKKNLKEALSLYFEKEPELKRELIKETIIERTSSPLISRIFL